MRSIGSITTQVQHAEREGTQWVRRIHERVIVDALVHVGSAGGGLRCPDHVLRHLRTAGVGVRWTDALHVWRHVATVADVTLEDRPQQHASEQGDGNEGEYQN